MTESCPGFATYRVLSNGQVEVNGTISTFSRGGAQEDELLGVWDRYSQSVSAASRRYDIPIAWILAIIAAESGGNPQACSPCSLCRSELCETGGGRQCCAFGPMQMIGIAAREYGTSPDAIMQNPSVAIDAGTAFLGDLADRFGFDLVRIAAAYNGGPGVFSKCSKTDSTFGWQNNGDYPMEVVRYANTAFSLGLKASAVGPAFLVAAVGLGAAYYLYQR